MSEATMTPLKAGTMQVSDHPFLASQPTAAADGFKNVSKTWYDKTISFDEGLELLTKGKAETEDIHLPMEAVTFEQEDNKLVVNLDGNKVFPNKHSLGQIAARLDIPSKILTNWYNSGDSEDVDIVARILNNGKRKYLSEEVAKKEDDEDSVSQKFRWRTRKDQSLRALVSQKYLPLDSQFFLESLSKIVPQGRLSHWDKTDGADTVYGNILIPDSLRKESDGGEYGGGLSVTNSEIATASLTVNPWLFARICQNGCIWDKIKGVSYKKVHLGNKINYENIFKEMTDCINKQIPLIPEHINMLMDTKNLSWSESSKKLMAQAAIDLGLTKKQGTELLLAYEFVPELSCFGLISAITRAGQKMEASLWRNMDIYATNLMSNWATYEKKAQALTAKDVESCYATVS